MFSTRSVPIAPLYTDGLVAALARDVDALHPELHFRLGVAGFQEGEEDVVEGGPVDLHLGLVSHFARPIPAQPDPFPDAVMTSSAGVMLLVAHSSSAVNATHSCVAAK